VARLPLFEKPEDYAAFERIFALALEKHPLRVLAYCLMPNHWHLVLWPRRDAELTAFVRWLTHTHAMRWHAHYHTSGTGHLYQGRFKAFPIEVDEHLYAVLRYVERNALRAGLVKRADAWQWSSLWRRTHGDEAARAALAPWPVPVPADWLQHVQAPQTQAELEAIRRSVVRGAPFGSQRWTERTAQDLGLEATLRSRGRPKQEK
jgi:putative transposase